jgi:hypothetical protein
MAAYLKRADRTHPVKAILMRNDLVVIVEKFCPGKRAIELRRTPVGASNKTPNYVLLLIKQKEFIL